MLDTTIKSIIVSFLCLLFITCAGEESTEEIIIEPQACSIPTNFDVSINDGTSITATWLSDNTISSFEIEFGPSGFNPNSGTRLPYNTNSAEINNLEVETEYDIYLRSKCGIEFSEWTGPLSFTTPCDLGMHQGWVILQTQKDVEDFGSLCYTGIDGTLRLDGFESSDPILDLSSLSHLTEITGSLEIRDNEDLENVNGLEGLQSVFGVVLWGNPKLISIKGLQNIEEITGAEATRNGGDTEPGIIIRNNEKLESLEGLEKISVVGQLSIRNNSSLKSLEGLINLTTVLDGVLIGGNSVLINLAGLNNLTNVQTDFLIGGNDSLTDLTGLQELKIVPGELNIGANESLITLKGIEVIEKADIITIAGNSSLTSLKWLNINQANRILNIRGNNSMTQIEEIEGTSSSCYMIIEENNNLTSLTGMENITELNGLDVFYNDNLNSLAGIDNLVSITRDIRFAFNPLLSDFCILTNLANNGFIGGDFVTQDNLYNPDLVDIQNGNCSQ